MAMRYEAKKAATTASAMAVKKNLLTPDKRVTGKKTMAVVRVGSKHGESHLFPTLFCRDHGWFAHLKMAIDVFQNHHGVVDEPGERQRQPTEHHAVDGRCH